MRGRSGCPECPSVIFGNTPAYAGKMESKFTNILHDWKHPRVCGEDLIQYNTMIPIQETPPRMRGRSTHGYLAGVRERNTPAYAGKIVGRFTDSSQSGKHPRVCGEDTGRAAFLRRDVETPPRMRGRFRRICKPSLIERNTPAYAGKIMLRSVSKHHLWKHPRVCGED